MGIKEMLASSQGAPSFFNANTPVGATITGTITATAIRQATDFMTKEPLVWQDGNPREQIVLTLATELRDQSIRDDDGTRTIYIKWWGAQRQAFVAAIRESGDDDVRVGGKFSATYLRDEPATERGLSNTKIYTYRYQPPTATSGLFAQAAQTPTAGIPGGGADPWAPGPDPWTAMSIATPDPRAAMSNPADDPWATQRNGNGNGNGHSTPQQPPLTPPPPAAAPAPAAAAPDPTAVLGQVKALILMGLGDAQIAAALNVNMDAVAAVRNLPA